MGDLMQEFLISLIEKLNTEVTVITLCLFYVSLFVGS